MKFEWDPNKNKANIKKHAVSFTDAETVFADKNAVFMYDDINSDKEERFIIIGIAKTIRRELHVCYCMRGCPQDEITRIISARKATKQEIKLYSEGISCGN
jgi:uncharacterized DUF497 family protein